MEECGRRNKAALKMGEKKIDRERMRWSGVSPFKFLHKVNIFQL